MLAYEDTCTYSQSMITPNQQLAPPTQLLEAGQAWAEAEALKPAIKEAKLLIPDLYADAVMAWRENMLGISSLVKEHGGIERVSEARPWSEDYALSQAINAVGVKDGEGFIPASQILRLPIIQATAPTTYGVESFPNTVCHQRHEVALSVAGGVPTRDENRERSDFDRREIATDLREVIESARYLPGKVAILERMKTTLEIDGQDEGQESRPSSSTIDLHYVIGADFDVHLDRDAPSLGADPAGYREWVLDGIRSRRAELGIDVFATGDTAHTARKSVWDQVKVIDGERSSEQALPANIERCGQLIGIYAASQFPHLLPYLASARS